MIEERTYNTRKLKRQIKEFQEYLVNRALSRDIVRNDRLYHEYIYLLRKYEEFFEFDKE